MKKVLTAAMLLAATSLTASAQSLYKTVLDKATAIVNNPASSEEQTQIAQFKVTCLNYIASQVVKRGTQVDSYFYDSQAVNLQSFITDYLVNLENTRQLSPTKRSEVIKAYCTASTSNPLFRDVDKEKVNCYINDKATLTPFCVDTDWEKAYDQATSKVRQILKK